MPKHSNSKKNRKKTTHHSSNLSSKSKKHKQQPYHKKNNKKKSSNQASSSSSHFDVPETLFDAGKLEKQDLDFFEQNPDYLQQFHQFDINGITKKLSPSELKPDPYPKKVISKASLHNTSSSFQSENEDDDHDDEDDDAFNEAMKVVTLNPDSDEEKEKESDDSDNDEIHQILIGSESEMENDVTNSKIEASDTSSSLDTDEEEVGNQEEQTTKKQISDISSQPDLLPKKRKRKQVEMESDDNLEEAYIRKYQEKKYQQSQIKPLPQRLPIKTQNGMIIQPPIPSPVNSLHSVSEADSASASESESEQEPELGSQPASDTASDSETKSSKKSVSDPSSSSVSPTSHPVKEIADISESILQAPEENLASFTVLLTYMKEGHPLFPKTQQLALLSLCQLFLDLIPGYKILPLTEAQVKEKVSKEVKQLRRYEFQFLKHYQAYLLQLEKCTKHSTLATSALVALCQLIEHHPHFNYRLNILNTLIHSVAKRHSRPRVLEALVHVFEKDEEGEVSGEAVRLIAKLVKKSNFKVHPDVIRVFERLRLKDELTLHDVLNKREKKEASSKKDTKLPRSSRFTKKQRQLGLHKTSTYMNRKQRKHHKVVKEVEASLKLSAATVDLEERKKQHRICLEHVFLTYFRVLKQAPQSRLLLPVLDGLKLFTHLISVDFFQSLLQVFKSHLHAPWVQPTQQLWMISTVYTLSQGQGELLYLDLTPFYASCYQLLPTLSLFSPTLSSTLHMLCQFLDHAFKSARTVDAKCITAFFMQLCHFVLHLDHPQWVLALLSLLHTWLHRFPALLTLFDVPSQRAMCGSYHYQLPNPVLANAAAATPWPLASLHKHWHPEVRRVVSAILKNTQAKQAGVYVGGIRDWHTYVSAYDWKDGAAAMLAVDSADVVGTFERVVGRKKSAEGKQRTGRGAKRVKRN